MAVTTKAHLPVVAADKFNVPPGSAIAAGTGAYGTASAAGASRWVLGSAIPKGRKLFVVVTSGAAANSPTAVKVALHGSATNSSGASGAEIASTVTEWATPAGNTVYTTEIDLAAVSDLTKYYSLAVSVNGAGATATLIASADAFVLDPVTT